MINFFMDETGSMVATKYCSTVSVEDEMAAEVEDEMEDEVEAEREGPVAASGQSALNAVEWLSFDENGRMLMDDAYFRRSRALAEANHKPGVLISDPCVRRLAVAKKQPKGLHLLQLHLFGLLQYALFQFY
jgi:hypothetical protein